MEEKESSRSDPESAVDVSLHCPWKMRKGSQKHIILAVNNIYRNYI